jgi:hypothetical protein
MQDLVADVVPVGIDDMLERSISAITRCADDDLLARAAIALSSRSNDRRLAKPVSGSVRASCTAPRKFPRSLVSSAELLRSSASSRRTWPVSWLFSSMLAPSSRCSSPARAGMPMRR